MLSIVGYEFGSQYKTDDNVILEVDEKGNRRVRFRPTSAEDTPEAMEQLKLAYLEARDDANINQLLLIPCVILDFLCIHPFRKGKGYIFVNLHPTHHFRYNTALISNGLRCNKVRAACQNASPYPP